MISAIPLGKLRADSNSIIPLELPELQRIICQESIESTNMILGICVCSRKKERIDIYDTMFLNWFLLDNFNSSFF